MNLITPNKRSHPKQKRTAAGLRLCVVSSVWGCGVNVLLQCWVCFVCLCRAKGLQLHYDLDVCRTSSRTDINELRAHRRQWQHKVNTVILNVTMELIVNIFRSGAQHFYSSYHRMFFVIVLFSFSVCTKDSLKFVLHDPVFTLSLTPYIVSYSILKFIFLYVL